MNFSAHLRSKLAVAVVSFPVVAAVILLPSPRLAGGPPGDGESTFRSKCSICHAVDGSGNTAMGKKMHLRDLRSAEVQKQSNEELAKVISQGRGKMPAYEKTLGSDKIREVAAYLRGLVKKS